MSSNSQALLLPLLGHFGLVVVLYACLTLLRARAVANGQVQLADFAKANSDPRRSSRVQRNLSNQFEAPMFVYFAAAVLLAAGAVQWWDVAAAWLFFAGRVIHTLVQTLTDNVALRGQVFVINFLGVAVLMGHVAVLAFSGSPR